MELILFSIKGTRYGMVLDNKSQAKTIKKIVMKKFWKNFHRYADRKQAMSDITIIDRIPFKCRNCGGTVSVEVYSKSDAMFCQDCFDRSLLPKFDKQIGHKVNNRLIDDGEVIFIMSQSISL